MSHSEEILDSPVGLNLQLPGLQLGRPDLGEGLVEWESMPRQWREGLAVVNSTPEKKKPVSKVGMNLPSPPVPPHRKDIRAPTPDRVKTPPKAATPPTKRTRSVPKKKPPPPSVPTWVSRSPSPVKKPPPPPPREDPSATIASLKAKLATEQGTVAKLTAELSLANSNCTSYQADLNAAQETIQSLSAMNNEAAQEAAQQAEEIKQLIDSLNEERDKVREMGAVSPRVVWQQSLDDKGGMLQDWEAALSEKQTLMEDRENNLRELETSLRIKERSVRDLSTREALLVQKEDVYSNLQLRESELNMFDRELNARESRLAELEERLAEEEQRLSLDWKELQQMKEIVKRSPALKQHELTQQESQFNRDMRDREDRLHEKAIEMAAWEKRLSSIGGNSPPEGIKLQVLQKTPQKEFSSCGGGAAGSSGAQRILSHLYEEESTPRTFSPSPFTPSPSRSKIPSWSLTQ
eukprot:TRINITY_DN3333_c4_g1_i1.p1 TRINITY_DN3333_c4_g1~~TRINITY_DN3333_c4_g1_i1.p1  ORF type:complete len:464 (+),score=125.82 TRINITY_DN3333_c4_g1_i1:63-1454(+)